MDVEHHAVPVGSRVLVCGGGIVGLECALMLAMEGKSVTVVDMLPVERFGCDMPLFNRMDLMDHLERNNVRLEGNMTINRFIEQSLEASDREGNSHTFEADTCVLALGVVPDNQLANEILSKYATDVYVVGDCVSEGRNFFHANQEAYHAAMDI